MKYSEFVKLSRVLEEKGSNVRRELGLKEDVSVTMYEKEEDETKKSIKKETEVKTGSPEELEVEETNLLQLATRWGRMKNELNNVGKKTQKHLTDKIVKKYFPRVLNVERQLFQKVMQSGEADYSKLKDVVLNQYLQIQDQQRKQVAMIENVILKYLNNTTSLMNKKINDSKINDTNKLVLSNYWNLLSTQIFMNLSMYMVKEREKIIDAIFARDKAMAEEVKKQAMAEERKKSASIQKKAKEEEAKVKATEKKMEKVAKREKEAKENPDVAKKSQKPVEDETERDEERTIK